MLDRVRPESSRVANRLEDLGRKLRHVAEVFEQEDNTAARNLAGMSWVDFETSGGKVLGASTIAMAAPAVTFVSLKLPLEEYRPRDISKMSWADRFEYADELPKQIKELEDAQQELKDKIDECDQEIADIDEQIADLQAQRDALQEKAADWRNKLKPDDDGLKWGFDDGILDAPWRTESDDMEDQIADLDNRIEGLQEERQGLIEQRAGYQKDLSDLDQRVNSLRETQEELRKTEQKGIPMDGPSDYHDAFPGKKDTNCTKYASSRRDVPCRGNAQEWDGEAEAAGYEVGERPVKGSVMVWESTFEDADDDYGHVAIVERVEPQDDGTYNIWYTDNNHTDPSKPEPMTIDPGEEDISFIYDKPPQASSAAST
jgi:surface antigen